MIYFDHSATAPMIDGLKDDVMDWLSHHFVNPSSSYGYAAESKREIEFARELIAKYIGADSKDNIIFTSGASESNALVLSNFDNIITSSFEHESILMFKDRNKEFQLCDPTPGGIITEEIFEEACRDNFGAELASIMLVNNELGTIQPIRELSKMAHTYGMKFHTDATSAFGIIPINVDDLDVDYLSASFHKIGSGIRGCGFLYARNPSNLNSIICGTQNNGLRGGTYPDLAIMTGRWALEHKIENRSFEVLALATLRGYLEDKVKDIPYLTINCKNSLRAPHVISLRVEDVPGERLLAWLEQSDILCSSGSACNSYTGEPSHVLLAIGLNEKEASETIRISFGSENEPNEIDILLAKIEEFHSIYTAT